MDSADTLPAPGAVELREDVPLKWGAGGGAWCAGGPRLVTACFAALSAAITLALLTQIYYGDYQVVPHGGVSTDAAACSGAGTDALKAGGRALDAAAAAALCLAVCAPHLTSLDASGSLLYWEYRQQARTPHPTLWEWGAPALAPGGGGTRPPRLLSALAALHAERGALPWPALLQPAIRLAKNGCPVSPGLAAALALAGGTPPPAGSLRKAPRLAAYLETMQHNTSAELARAWVARGAVRAGAAAGGAAGAWRVYAGGAGAARVLAALAAALSPPPATTHDATTRVNAALQQQAAAPPGGVATGLAVVDTFDTYVALVTGLSVVFGSGAAGAGAGAGAAWTRDDPPAPLDLAPAIMTDGHICGTRFVMGGASHAALAQAGAALATSGEAGAAAAETGRAASAPGSVNVVRQRADALLSHADSRGGGIASRF